MCNYVPGQLIMTYRNDDSLAFDVMVGIREELFPGITYQANLHDHLYFMDVRSDERIQRSVHLLAVAPGDELWGVDILQAAYANRALDSAQDAMRSYQLDIVRDADRRMVVGFNHRLSAVAAGGALSPVFFSTFHTHYKTMIGQPNLGSLTGSGITVGVLDSGIKSTSGVKYTTSDSVNLVNDRSSTSDVEDGAGHGTVVASVLQDVAPDAELLIYRVLDNQADGSEWDAMAALLASEKAQILNMSLQFSLKDRTCTTCKRQSESSRSRVFKAMLRDWLDADDRRMVVAAAGNWQQTKLAYPSRFGDMLAVVSVNSQGNLSSFTNRGTTDEDGQPHNNVFLVPGGDDPPTTEDVASFGRKSYRGTSFAVPYATGVLACLWENAQNIGVNDRTDMLQHLQGSADTSCPGHTVAGGNGLLFVT